MSRHRRSKLRVGDLVKLGPRYGRVEYVAARPWSRYMWDKKHAAARVCYHVRLYATQDHLSRLAYVRRAKLTAVVGQEAEAFEALLRLGAAP